MKQEVIIEEPKTLFELWAKKQNITVEEMWTNIAARIEQGTNDPDPEETGIVVADTTRRRNPHARRMAPLCGGVAGEGRARRPAALVQNLLILALHPLWGIDLLYRKGVHLYQIWPPSPVKSTDFGKKSVDFP